jgi:hypothetical protein
MINEPVPFLIELSRAEAALAIAISRGEDPPLWASNCFKGSIDSREEESEHTAWVPNGLIRTGSLHPELTLAERIEAEHCAVVRELGDCEHGYYALPLNATCGIQAHAVISISGHCASRISRKLIGYADDQSVLPLIRSCGVREPDFRKQGIRTLPSFKAAVSDVMTRVPSFRDPQARGIHAAFMNASYGSVRRSAAKWFINNFIEKHRCIPTGSFTFEVDFGPDLPVRNAVVRGAQGRLEMQLDFPPIHQES